MFNHKPQLTIFYCLVIALCLTTIVPTAVLANPGDWGLVQRFKKQLAVAQAGNVKAMYDVGKLYERGRGVKKDIVEAANWFKKASQGNYAPAQARLGILYFEGRGVKQDYNQALKLLNIAAKENVPSAQYQLANMYELGTGVKQNLKQAIFWYQKANRYGHYTAKAKAERLTKLLQRGGTINRATDAKAVAKAKQAPSPVIQKLLGGSWQKRGKPIVYLPSAEANCNKDSYNTMRCISKSQERDTGREVITFNTESTVTITGKNKFKVVYTNLVLEVAVHETVDGNGEVIEQTPSRIKKGKQGKSKTVNCSLANKNLLNCSKGSLTFDLKNAQ